MEGVLSKWVNYVYGWKNRYFTLREGVLEYRRTKGGPCKDRISLSFAQIIPNPDIPAKFRLLTGSKTLFLQAHSTEEARRWISALVTAQTSLAQSPLQQMSIEVPSAVPGLDLSQLAEELKTLQGRMKSLTEEMTKHGRDQPIVRLAKDFKDVSGHVLDLVQCYKSPGLFSARLVSEQSDSSVSSVEFKDAVDDQEEAMFNEATEVAVTQSVSHRSSMPVQRNPNQKINIWKVIRDSIGKDLTRIAVPVYFNEPVSFIQRFSEELTYEELLRNAASAPQAELRMAYIAAFTVSSYATTLNRTMKPFNPILGETFELQRDGFSLVSEQVCHHPPITALHCSSPDFEFSGSLEPRTKFKGSYMHVHADGTLHIRLLRWNEEYSWTKPDTSVHNIILGTIYVDHHGSYTVFCPATGVRADVTFKGAGWFAKSKQQITAVVYDSVGTARYKLEGTWSESIDLSDLVTGEVRPIWRHAPMPENHEFNYFFTDFAMQLNLPPEHFAYLPSTDSRFRPDQRALENGDIDTAASEKHRLEEKQRSAKRSRDEMHIEYRPRWFSYIDSMWRYHGGYWEEKAARGFTNIPDIF
jgi:hypothetical protein